MHDLRYGLRSLARSPAFTVVTLASLALGIGATTAIFQLIDALSLRPLPVERPEELARVRIHDRQWLKGRRTGPHADLSNPLWEAIRAGQRGFSSVGAFSTDCDLNLTQRGLVRSATGLCATGDYFGTLGVPPYLGRVLTPADDQRGCKDRVAVVSHSFWQRELGGDPAAVGRKLELDQHTFEVIGVTPPGFHGPEAGRSFDITIPLCTAEMWFDPGDSFHDKSWYYLLTVVGRLAPGWTVERASAQLAAVSPGIMEATAPGPPFYDAELTARYKAYRLEAVPGTTGVSWLRTEYAKPLSFLFAIAALVLLITCANLANLLLARAAAREREIAVRLAIGASRWRLARQLLVESLLLAVAGAVLGLGLARFVTALILALLPDPELVVVEPGLDWRVLAFTAGLTLVTCVLFGLAPALRGARTDVGQVLKASPAHATGGRRRFTLRRILVAAQVAMSFALLAGALLFARSFAKLVAIDPGFQTEGVTRLVIDLDARSREKTRWAPKRAQVLERVRAAPGVESAAFSRMLPLAGGGWGDRVWPDGAEAQSTASRFDRVGAGYFETLGIPLLVGRDFGPGDVPGAPRVAVVNRAFARALFAVDDPVGRRFRMEPLEKQHVPPVYEIVGIVADTKYRDLRDELKPIAYLADSQDEDRGASFNLHVRSRLPAAKLAAALEPLVLEASPSAVLDVTALDDVRRDSIARDRLLATLAGLFGTLAALLAAAGIYGMVSYSLARRAREIGIRVALGADRIRVARLIFGEVAVLLSLGLLVGAALALAAGRGAAALLYGLSPHDPASFAIAAALLIAVAALATLPATLRALRVDPMVVLREE